MLNPFRPSTPLLAPHLQHVYVCEYTGPDCEITVLPHPCVTLTIFENVRLTPHGDGYYEAMATDTPHVLLQTMSTHAVKLRLVSGIRFTVLLFPPLGICHFIRPSLSDLVQGHDPMLVPLHDDLTSWACDVAATLPYEEKLRKIESGLAQNYRCFSCASLLQALELLCDLKEERDMKDIAQAAGLSLRTMNRLFQQHLCMAPVQFRNLCRFRFSFNTKMEQQQLSSTELAYRSNYTDYPHMSRMYKKLTGFSPAELFSLQSPPGAPCCVGGCTDQTRYEQ